MKPIFSFLLLFCLPLCAGTLNVPAQYPTVQAALNAAQPGDTVKVGAGIFSEDVSTSRGGNDGARIVVDGQKLATIRQFNFRHPFITLQNMAVTGTAAQFSRLVYMGLNAHHSIITGCLIDGALAPKVFGITWESGSVKPFDVRNASDCVVSDNTITRILAATLISVMGERNILRNNQLLDSGQVDFFRLWGRNNLISGNRCVNNYTVLGLGNHPDFIQTFGVGGDGSESHIIENNFVDGIEGGQLTQLEGNLLEEIRDWTFRNNIFMNVALQASCTVPGIKYYNNVFYRCNKVGHALTFGIRVHTPGNSYNGTEGTNYAHGGEVKNNVFLECGDTRNTVGWYGFNAVLTGVSADHNYVAKAGFARVDQDAQRRAIGSAGGWSAWGGWWEPNGINGGDPGFVNLATNDFHLIAGSPLIGKATPSGDIGAFPFSPVEPPPPDDPPPPAVSRRIRVIVESSADGQAWEQLSSNIIPLE